MHIWHDNSGRHSSWFLKYIIVRDLQTMDKFYFIGQQWLAIDKGDGKVKFYFSSRQMINLFLLKIERVFPVSNEYQMRELVNSFSEKTYDNLTDDHLWFSIFSRPSSTRFTRVQRCVCCFVLLFIGMLLNILYYDQIEEAKSETTADGLLIGPFYFTKEQVYCFSFIIVFISFFVVLDCYWINI
jgi:polycystin 1L2